MSTSATQRSAQQARLAVVPALRQVCSELHDWLQARDFSGHEPGDLGHSPLLDFPLIRHTILGTMIDRTSHRWGGTRLRHWMSVPRVKTPASVASVLSASCDLYPFDPTILGEIRALRKDLVRLASPGEQELCWGAVSHVHSGSDGKLHTFAPDAVTSCLCGLALLNAAGRLREGAASLVEQAGSVARFLLTRLNRTVDRPDEICFSSTPESSTQVFYVSAMVGGFIARLWQWNRNDEYLELAQRAMNFIRNHQLATGAWYYGMSASQHRILAKEHSKTLCALREYRQCTNDSSFDECLERGHEAYKRCFFETDGTPKYSFDRTYPIDISACAQAISHFCSFALDDLDAVDRALQVFDWTCRNMRNPDGTFLFRRHSVRVQRTPYVAWGQARVFYALARLRSTLAN